MIAEGVLLPFEGGGGWIQGREEWEEGFGDKNVVQPGATGVPSISCFWWQVLIRNSHEVHQFSRCLHIAQPRPHQFLCICQGHVGYIIQLSDGIQVSKYNGETTEQGGECLLEWDAVWLQAAPIDGNEGDGWDVGVGVDFGLEGEDAGRQHN